MSLKTTGPKTRDGNVAPKMTQAPKADKVSSSRLQANKGIKTPAAKNLRVVNPKIQQRDKVSDLHNHKQPSVSQTQKKATERVAENAARNRLYRMGYHNVHRLQYNKSGHGVDLGAIKRDKSGRPATGAVIEVKGRSGPTPGPSAFKKQVRPGYYIPRLEKAKRAGVRGADDLYRLAKENKVSSYGATYGQQGLRLYQVPKRGPVSKRPV